jgi:hypothetical protein
MTSTSQISPRRRLGFTLLLVAVVAFTSGLQFWSCAVGGKWQRWFKITLRSDQPELWAIHRYINSVRSIPTETSIPHEIEDKLALFDFVQSTSYRFRFKLQDSTATCPCTCCTIVGFEPDTDLSIRPLLEDDSVRDLGPNEIWAALDNNLTPGDTIVIAGQELKVTARLLSIFPSKTCYVRMETFYNLVGKFDFRSDMSCPKWPEPKTSIDIKLKPIARGGVPEEEAIQILTKDIPEIEVNRTPHANGNFFALVVAARILALLLWPGLILCFAAVFVRFRRAKRKGSRAMLMLTGSVIALIGAGLGLGVSSHIYLLIWNPVASLLYKSAYQEGYVSYGVPRPLDPGIPAMADLIPLAICITLLAIVLALAAVMISEWRARRNGGEGIQEG